MYLFFFQNVRISDYFITLVVYNGMNYKNVQFLNSQCEQGDHHFDALVGSLLVMVLRSLYGIKQAIPVIWYP